MKTLIWAVLVIVAGVVQSDVFAQSDTLPPVLLDFDLSPRIVDTSLSNAVITANVRIADDLSGLAYQNLPDGGALPRFDIQFRSASAMQRVSARVNPDQFVVGDGRTGSFIATLTLPQFAEGGLWTLFSAQFYDAAGNSVSYDATDFHRRGFPFQFTNTATGDTNAPRLLDFSIQPESDATTNRVFKARARVTDDLAGWRNPIFSPNSFAQIFFEMLGPGQVQATSRNLFTLISGDEHDGIYESDFTMSPFSAAGIWIVNRVVIADSVGNARTITTGDLLASGFSARFTLQGPEDVSPPELIDVKLLTPRVNTATNSQIVAFNVQVKDNLSGFVTTEGSASWLGSIGITLVSPSKKQTALLNGNPINPFGGTSDTFLVQLLLPRYAEGGVWQIRTLSVGDATGNSKQYDLGSLSARGFPVQVINDNPPPFRIEKSGSVIVLSWPKAPGGFALQATAAIRGMEWSNVRAAPISDVEQNIVILPTTDRPSTFFRLLQPP